MTPASEASGTPSTREGTRVFPLLAKGRTRPVRLNSPKVMVVAKAPCNRPASMSETVAGAPP